MRDDLRSKDPLSDVAGNSCDGHSAACGAEEERNVSDSQISSQNATPQPSLRGMSSGPHLPPSDTHSGPSPSRSTEASIEQDAYRSQPSLAPSGSSKDQEEIC